MLSRLIVALVVSTVLGLLPAVASAEEPCNNTTVEGVTVNNEALRVAQGATFLPDCRAYEMVSPADKNGGDVMADTSRTRAAEDGDAVQFTSLKAFGDSLGSGITDEYISRRSPGTGASGWVTHSIIPRVDALSAVAAGQGYETAYQGEFSPDLDRAIVRSYTPLTNDTNVAGVSNIYLRSDALTSGEGAYTLLSPCPVCSSPLADPKGGYKQFVADSTPDLGQVLFEARRQLTSDAPPERASCLLGLSVCNPSLYEWDHGILRFVGILPNGEPAPISIASIGASQQLYTPNTLSDDGSKIFFTVPPNRSSLSGDLYMRLNHSTTVQLNASERTDCADHDPCAGIPEPDPAGPQPANFAIPSPDGSKVFFYSEEQLTDAHGGTLYVYDTTLAASDPHHLRHVYTDQQPDDGTAGYDGGVIGTSTDGSYVYFFYSGALLPGQASLPDEAKEGIYAWHEGTVTFAGSIDSAGSSVDSVLQNWQGRGQGARVSRDGRKLLFTSYSGAGLPGDYDHGTTCGSFGGEACAELYLYSTQSGTTHCVSCNPSGATATTDATFDVHVGIGTSRRTSHLNHPLSDDGQHVFFETAERLLPSDINGNKTDVYEWTALGAGGCTTASADYGAASEGCLSLITSGASPDDSHFLEASPSGNDVFVSTSQRLVGWDTDNNYDLYDVRVGGGFPEPEPVKADCSNDGCQGVLPGSPSLLAPASVAFFGETGNVTSIIKKPVPPRTTNLHKLRRALKACKKRKKPQRKKCEVRARRDFGGLGASKSKGAK